jgi:hypothetical protein
MKRVEESSACPSMTVAWPVTTGVMADWGRSARQVMMMDGTDTD